ncbi:hypothetical protein [Pseudarthrobacter sp. YAF2]|uniref:hypothetical protein n=1 Tax=Pseudarthrobacter sp. YAF2 TaxID=3233078 RepID=UPI003F9A1C01
MNNSKRATLIWSLGAVIFSLLGVYTAMASAGTWYLVLSAVILLLAGVVFASKAVLTNRAAEKPSPS